MSPPNLAIAHIKTSQDHKEVTANAAIDTLDLAMTESGLLDVSAGGIVSVPAAPARGLVRLVLTGTPGAAVTVAFPAVKRLVLLRNGADGVAITPRAGGIATRRTSCFIAARLATCEIAHGSASQPTAPASADIQLRKPTRGQ